MLSLLVCLQFLEYYPNQMVATSKQAVSAASLQNSDQYVKNFLKMKKYAPYRVGHKSDNDISFYHFSFVEVLNRLNWCSNRQKKLAGTRQTFHLDYRRKRRQIITGGYMQFFFHKQALSQTNGRRKLGRRKSIPCSNPSIDTHVLLLYNSRVCIFTSVYICTHVPYIKCIFLY